MEEVESHSEAIISRRSKSGSGELTRCRRERVRAGVERHQALAC